MNIHFCLHFYLIIQKHEKVLFYDFQNSASLKIQQLQIATGQAGAPSKLLTHFSNLLQHFILRRSSVAIESTVDSMGIEWSAQTFSRFVHNSPPYNAIVDPEETNVKKPVSTLFQWTVQRRLIKIDSLMGKIHRMQLTEDLWRWARGFVARIWIKRYRD